MVTASFTNINELIQVTLAGMIGALVKDTLKDGCLQLPSVKDGKLFLGFLGGAFIGAFIGACVDGNVITAALAGYTGSSVLTKLLLSNPLVSRALDKPKSGVKVDKDYD